MNNPVYKKYTHENISWIGPDIKTDIPKSDIVEDESVLIEFREPDDPALTRLERMATRWENYKHDPYIYVILSTYLPGDPIILLENGSFAECFKRIMGFIDDELENCRYYASGKPDIEGLLKGHQIIRATHSPSSGYTY